MLRGCRVIAVSPNFMKISNRVGIIESRLAAPPPRPITRLTPLCCLRALPPLRPVCTVLLLSYPKSRSYCPLFDCSISFI